MEPKEHLTRLLAWGLSLSLYSLGMWLVLDPEHWAYVRWLLLYFWAFWGISLAIVLLADLAEWRRR